MKRMEAFCEEVVAMLLTAYLFIVFCMFPFYMRNGYMEIGKDKYNFYKAITMGGFGLIIPLVLLCIMFHIINWRIDRNRLEEDKEGSKEGEEAIQEPYAGWCGKLSGTDWAVLAYGICVILSYIG